MISKVLVFLGFLGALFVCGAERASATVCSVPNSFSNGAVINAAPFNANFTALVTCTQNIDNTNIGAAGIFASQVIPLTVGEATFAGSVAYTFPSSIILGIAGSPTTAGLRLGNGTSSQTLIDTNPVTVSGVSSALLRIGNSGGGTLAALDNSGNLGIAGAIGAVSLGLSGGVLASNVTDSALTSGNCVQASTGGLLTTIANPCSSRVSLVATMQATCNAVSACNFTVSGGPLPTGVGNCYAMVTAASSAAGASVLTAISESSYGNNVQIFNPNPSATIANGATITLGVTCA